MRLCRPLVVMLCLLVGGMSATFLGAVPVFAALTFPALTGRVVDDAHILSVPARQMLSQRLADFEAQSTDQVVVVTLPSLQGDSIEDFGYKLGRKWGIGQKGRDNGVLLIVAPNERKVRIEVGYGLEPVLTDAASSQIIQSIMLPDFRQGLMEQGVVAGADAIVSLLGGKALPPHPVLQTQADVQLTPLQLIFVVLGFIVFLWMCARHPVLTWWLLSNSIRIGGGRSEGSGWGGGGGSFGGGGASGGW